MWIREDEVGTLAGVVPDGINAMQQARRSKIELENDGYSSLSYLSGAILSSVWDSDELLY
jgi:hypothetical protein